MPRGRRLLLAIAMVVPSIAAASGMTIEGDVIAAQSHWTDDGDRIVTEAVVRTAAGDVVVSQLGGTANGLTMRQMPGPELLAPGMHVAVAARSAMDLSLHEHLAVETVKVLAYPPSFVRTGPTKAGKSLFWESGCIFVTIDDDGTKEINGDNEFTIVDQSIATWNTAGETCSYMQVVSDGRAKIEVGNDKVNVIKFRDASWCRPASKNDMARCYSGSAAGITTAVYVDDASSSRDGAIVDADIEINGVDFAISASGVTLGDAPCKAELANTLTHELGHLHGLEHPCLASGDPPRTDDQGRAVPSCSSQLPPEITEATMYNFQDCGETKKESLSQDEVTAMCTIYPKAMDPGSCEPVGGGSGCCSASDRPGPAVLLAGLTLVMLSRRRRA